MVIQLRGTVDELTDAVAKKEKQTWRHQAESEDHARWYKEEQERYVLG